MVLDSFERDFYIDLGDMAQSVDTRTASVAEQMGAVNYFAPHMVEDSSGCSVTFLTIAILKLVLDAVKDII